ncbi:MAG: hypothetical protein K5750_08150 [Eubacterium sp.]|nr:hypothetical protein [Eubacterium sp.]
MERKYQLGTRWRQFKAQTTLRADGRENTLQNVENADLYQEFKPADKYLADAEMKVYMRKKLSDASKTTTRSENLEAGFGGAFSNAYPLAKRYVYNEYNKMIRNAGRGGSNPSVQELDNIFGKEDFLKTYQKQIDDLASNKEFRELAEKSPKTCIAKWSKMVRQQPQVARVDQAPQNAVVNAPVNAPKQKVTGPKKVETKVMGHH